MADGISDEKGVSNKLFCPEVGCPYHESSEQGKFFRKQLLLDQHVANRHRERQFQCNLCLKKYAFSWQLGYHQKYCNQIWKCLSCDKTYSERLSLVMHCKRQGHSLPESAKGWSPSKGKQKRKKQRHKPSSQSTTTTTSQSPVTVIFVPVVVASAVPVVVRSERSILPKETEVRETVSVSTQTIETGCSSKTPEKVNRISHVTHRSSICQSQRGTQTDKRKKSSSAQCAPFRGIRRRNRGSESERGQESIQTQTLESVLSRVPEVKTASTNVGSSMIPFSVSTSTEIPKESDTSRQEWTSAVSQMEMSVQTDDLTNNLDFEPLQYSTTETQTMETEHFGSFSSLPLDDDLLSAVLNMNDIETQTNWNHDGTTQTDAVNFSEFNFSILPDYDDQVVENEDSKVTEK